MSNDFMILESSSRKATPDGVISALIRNAGVLDTDPQARDAAPGSTAYTADMSFMAMKDPDGVWQQIGG